MATWRGESYGTQLYESEAAYKNEQNVRRSWELVVNHVNAHRYCVPSKEAVTAAVVALGISKQVLEELEKT